MFILEKLLQHESFQSSNIFTVIQQSVRKFAMKKKMILINRAPFNLFYTYILIVFYLHNEWQHSEVAA